jgi:DNA-binding transcriptional MerR regulator
MFYTGKPMIRYSIKDLEKLTGIKAHTIRIWEKRYHLIEPERTSTNIRYYSDKDLKKLLNVSILNRNGLKISNIVNMDIQEMNERILEISETSLDQDNQIEQLIVAMIDFDEARFDKVLTTSIIKLGFDETVTKLLYPFFEKIGLLWQIGTIFPAQEHFVSGIIRQKLIIAIDGQSTTVKPGSKSILIYLPSGEWHELGILFFHYLSRKQGLKVIYLGQSLPFEDLIEVDGKQTVDYLFTSLTTPLTQKKYTEYLQQLSLTFPEKTIFITGNQTREHLVDLPGNVIRIDSPEAFIERIS